MRQSVACDTVANEEAFAFDFELKKEHPPISPLTKSKPEGGAQKTRTQGRTGINAARDLRAKKAFFGHATPKAKSKPCLLKRQSNCAAR
jgi:hypothetical protein